jgi:arylsulfatase
VVTRRAILQAPAFIRALASSTPNLLLLMDDQHRGDCLSCAGHPAVKTPNLDRLAAEGVRFQHAYSSTPTCTPARAALLTGQGPWDHGMLGYGRVADRYPTELPRVLAASGYHTFAIGKLHYAPQRNLHGFQAALLDESGRVESPDFRSDYRSWFASQAPNLGPDATGIGWNDYTAKPYVLPERLHPTTWTADCAVRFLETYNRPQPFFLKVSFARPHSPYNPPQRFWDKYESAPIPAAAQAAWSDRYRPRNSDQDDIWHGDVGQQAVRRARQGYYGSVSFVDEQIGRILESLDKRRLLDQTRILFISDHGDMTGDHFLWRKSYAYEPSARIPFLLRQPDGPRGQVNSTPVEIRDVLGILQGQPLPQREWIDLEHNICYDPSNHWNAPTDGKEKYIYHALDGEEQFFDLTRDPLELNPLPASSRRNEWRQRLTKHLAPRGSQFVRGGELVPRPEGLLYSPNYPR